jgi:hypothetical protein
VISTIDDIRQRTWDFALTIVTVVMLGLLGVQSFIGTGYVWWAERTIPQWESGPGYAAYVALMNDIAAPLLVVLVVAMGLCVPKRLFGRRVLLGVSAGMIAAGLVVGVVTRSLVVGMAVYLVLAALIQVAVVVLTIAGVRGPSYLTEGRLTKTGSGLLHLGFILFALVVDALQTSPWMLAVFSASALLSIAGTALSFYAYRIAWRRTAPVEDAPFDWDGSEPRVDGSAEVGQDSAGAVLGDASGEDVVD